MKKIRLAKGKYALVDDNDFEWLSQWRWYYTGKYASRADSKRGTVYMHREVNKTPKGLLTDHRDNNGLNNQRRNLRTVSRQQNVWNTPGHGRRASKFKGAYYDNRAKASISKNPWVSRIMHNRKNHFLGRFSTEKAAASAYKKAAKRLFGQYVNIKKGRKSWN